jgi:hypothetical protein
MRLENDEDEDHDDDGDRELPGQWRRQDPGLVGSNLPPFQKKPVSAADQGIDGDSNF